MPFLKRFRLGMQHGRNGVGTRAVPAGGYSPGVGSFTEIVMAFDFKPDTPDWVVGSFAPWRVGSGGPPLTFAGEAVPEERRWQLEEIEAHEDDDDHVPRMSDLSQAELSAVFRMSFEDMPTAYFPGTSDTKLVWNDHGWHWALTTRHYRQCGATSYRKVIEPLGEFVCPHASVDHPAFVGYLKYEYDDRPLFIWHRGGSLFEFEDTRTHLGG